jgi:hypothetical protein
MTTVKQSAALSAFANHFVFNFVIQLENYLLYVMHGERSSKATLISLASFPFLQLESIVFSGLLGLVAWMLATRRAGRWIAVILVFAANTYVMLDQVVYGLFFDHTRISSAGGRTPDLRLFVDSYLARLPLVIVLNLVLLAAFTVLLWRALFLGKHPLLDRVVFARRRTLMLALAIGAPSVAVAATGEHHNLEHHPVLTLLFDSLQTRRVPSDPDWAAPLFDPRYGVEKIEPAESAAIAKVHDAIRSRAAPPNIVFVVLESVGAEQLLDHGAPDRIATPFLFELSRHALLFDSVYSSFPGTARSHVDINTGGRIITYGSVYDELSHKYDGPLLVSEMKRLGYQTGCFDAAGDLSNENMDSFYERLGFETFVHFGKLPLDLQEKYRVNSWGGDEDAFRKMAIDWIDADKKISVGPSKPFFLAFYTNSTHHPYSAPAGYAGPYPGRSDKDRYRDALSYSDSVLRKLADDLASRRLLDDTIWVVTGDHGESFGEVHAENLLHRNHVYEENVRTFVMIADRAKIPEPILSHRLGAIADLMPSMISLVAADVPSVPGQSLLLPEYRMRIVYFHKSVFPPEWGLRDGRWKFIGSQLEGRPFELYDLEDSPNEANNVAQSHRDMVAAYDALCRSWYVRTNEEFVHHLVDFKLAGGRPLIDAAQIRLPGPKIISFGFMRQDGGFEDLGGRVNPCEDLTAWTQWVNYPADKTVTYQWTSPSGQVIDQDFKVKAEWSRTTYGPKLKRPIEEGTWLLALKDGDQRLLSKGFEVSREAPLGLMIENARRTGAPKMELDTKRCALTVINDPSAPIPK